MAASATRNGRPLLWLPLLLQFLASLRQPDYLQEARGFASPPRGGLAFVGDLQGIYPQERAEASARWPFFKRAGISRRASAYAGHW